MKKGSKESGCLPSTQLIIVNDILKNGPSGCLPWGLWIRALGEWEKKKKSVAAFELFKWFLIYSDIMCLPPRGEAVTERMLMRHSYVSFSGWLLIEHLRLSTFLLVVFLSDLRGSENCLSQLTFCYISGYYVIEQFHNSNTGFWSEHKIIARQIKANTFTPKFKSNGMPIG